MSNVRLASLRSFDLPICGVGNFFSAREFTNENGGASEQQDEEDEGQTLDLGLWTLD
jgi:hypothetical protein